MTDRLEQEIRAIAAEILEIDPKTLAEDGQFNATLKAVDSVALLEILVTLERTYHISILEEELKKISNWHDIIELVRQKTT